MKKKDKTIALISIIVAAILIISGISAYLTFYTPEKKPKKEEKPEEKIDDRISPYTNHGLFIQVLRIRNRGLLDKMLSFGTSWKNPPRFYYNLTVDGEESSVKGNVGTETVYNTWDTFGQESTVTFYIEEEQEKSDVTIKIIEEVKTGLFNRRTTDVVKEKIDLTYDFRTGRWNGDDSFKDKDGYGHYLGDNYEVWFNIYQSDYDHDGIPYWTEVNVLGTDPTIDDSELDPDNDSIPTSWEWKWGYDPFTWNDHENLDPDVDGIENIEEYQMAERLANPYQPDIYIETDGMEKRAFWDLPHFFMEESQQMIIERFSQHGINVYIDDGWPDGPVNGGGEKLPFYKNIEDIKGKQMLSFYKHNFPDERKGIFRYIVVGNKYDGFTNPVKYNKFDVIHIGTGYKPLLTRMYMAKSLPTPKFFRIGIAKVALHELGHTLGLVPVSFPGNDIQPRSWGDRYPNMSDEKYESYMENYHSVMNYVYIWERSFFDYSNGSNGHPYDQNDWKHIYLPSFQVDQISYEEPVDETFEDFEEVNDYPGVVSEEWKLDKNLTNQYSDQLKNLATVKNTDVNISVYVKTAQDNKDEYNVRIYAMPKVEHVHAVWTLIGEGKTDNNEEIQLYSQHKIIEEKMAKI